MFFTMSNAITNVHSKQVPDSDIFWNLDGSYFVIQTDDPCDRTFVEKADGSGYEFIFDCKG